VPPAPPHRILSLLPAATEIVCALGAFEQLVGVTHECDFPNAVGDLPRVTTSVVDRDASSRAIDEHVRALSAGGAPLFALDAQQLQRLAPTLIVTQSLCEVCAVSEGDLRQLAAVLTPAPRVLSLSGSTLDGVWRDIAAIGAAIGRSAEAAALLASIDERLHQVHETLHAARAPRPRVAVIEWLDPLFVAGHWTPELVRRAGGVDVLATAGSHSAEIGVERIRAAEPELLIFAPCGFDVGRAERESAALLASPEWAWARGTAAWAIDGNALTSRPGPRLADAVEVMAGMVAPGLFGSLASHYARRLKAAS
jgi:iron complex transport system substrate-binding protein